MLAGHAPRPSPLVRLTNAARLATMRSPTPVEVQDPNILHTPRLTVRHFEWTDRDEFRRVISLSRACLEAHCPLHRDDESDDALFDRMLDLSRRGCETGRAWRVALFDAERRLVGLVNLNDIVRGLESQAEANWWISADAQGRGFATEALRASLQHAFADLPRGLGLQRVTALIAPENLASRRVAGKVGMKRDNSAGLRPLVINGRSTEHHTFQIFAPLTAPRRKVSRRPSLRAGLASILSTEDAVRLHVF
jgi:RimJ/RimL family protein N-acetyltransferase